MHIISSIYFYHVIRSIIHMFLFVVLPVQLKYIRLFPLCCNTAYLFYVCQTSVFLIGKLPLKEATTNNKSIFPY